MRMVRVVVVHVMASCIAEGENTSGESSPDVRLTWVATLKLFKLLLDRGHAAGTIPSDGHGIARPDLLCWHDRLLEHGLWNGGGLGGSLCFAQRLLLLCV